MTSLRSTEYQVFLQRLVTARRIAKMSQAEVAKLLDKTQSFVSKSESGERRVDVVELAAFARIYRKPLTFFLQSENRGRDK